MWGALVGAAKTALRGIAVRNTLAVAVRPCSSSPTREKLMAFFDEKENWGKSEIRVGRAWKPEELRIKSNEDLHKLWYVLLKERNMLLTMEHEAERLARVFPNPERLDKVNISMRNLESVVRERNCAYHLLETGENGERPQKVVSNPIGMKFKYRQFEHRIPFSANEEWRKTHVFRYKGHAVQKFLGLMREKKRLEYRKAINRDRNHIIGLFRRYPDMDAERLQEMYPRIDVLKIKEMRKARGHYVPEEYAERTS